MKIYKIIKHEIKNLLYTPFAVFLIITVLNIVFGISVFFTKDKNFIETMMFIDNIICKAGCAVVICSLIFVTATNLWKNINIYRLSNTKESYVVTAQILLIFLLTTIFVLILIIESTVLNIIINKRLDIIADNRIITLSMVGKPAACWLYSVASGFFACVVYASILAVTPLAYKISNPYIKRITIAIVLIGIFFLQIDCCSLFGKIAGKLNFNNYTINGKEFNYIPGFILAKYSNFDSFNLTINILNLGVLLWEIIFILLCFLIYSIRLANLKPNDLKNNLKGFIIKVTAVSVFLISNIGFYSYATFDAKFFKEIKKHSNNYIQTTAQTGEEIDLNKLIAFNNDNVFNKYEINYEIRLYNKNKYNVEIKNNNDSKLIIPDCDKVLVVVKVKNKYTSKALILFFDIIVNEN